MTPLWLKWWIGSVDDTKLRMVASECLRPVGDVVAVWASILERCARADVPGTCDNLSFDEIAFQLGYDASHVESIVDAMRHRGLMTDNTVTSWNRRQETKHDKTGAERQRKFKERSKQPITEVTAVTIGNALPAVTESGNALGNTDGILTDGKRKETTKRAARRPEYTEDFETFWKIYPPKTNRCKVDTWACWLARIEDGYTAAEMVEGAKHYAMAIRRDKTELQYVKGAERFLGPDHPFTDIPTPTPEEIEAERKYHADEAWHKANPGQRGFVQ
jgi:hypothetical protein